MKKTLSSNYCIPFDKGSHPRVCNFGPLSELEPQALEPQALEPQAFEPQSP